MHHPCRIIFSAVAGKSKILKNGITQKYPNLVRRNYSEASSSTGESAESSGANSGHWRRKMSSWEIHSYGDIGMLQLNTTARVPIIKSPEDVLIKVKAASVNPIDVAMMKGYGSELIGALRKLERGKLPRPNEATIDFPITLGRDFAGTVVEKGSGVNNLSVGDEVYGCLGFTEHGSHGEFTVARGDMVRQKPSNISFTEAASFPYVGLTCWSAIRVTGGLVDLTNKKFLVLGGSGGAGTFALQYLVSNGAQVITTCSTDAVAGVEGLAGFGTAIDYTQSDYIQQIQSHAPFDCVLNLSGPRNDCSQFLKFLKPLCGQYITLSPPLLSNFDKYGFLGGLLKNAAEVLKDNVNSVSNRQVLTKWAFFMPSSIGMCEIGRLIETKKIQPVIEKTFQFADLPSAYQRIEGGHLRGKVVVEF